MSRKLGIALVALAFGITSLLNLASPVSAAVAPGRITFLAASCPSNSSMYSRVVAGQDPNSNENGNGADPADISAYGCSQVTGVGLFLLANSTSGSVFLDESLQQAATVSSSEDGPAGGATIIAAGTTVYVPGDVAQTRRFSVSNYPVTISSRAAMPFLDLHCLTDGNNNDNADGAGWGDQAIGAGSQTYCIAYIWDGIAAPTPTPNVTSTPTQAPTATPTAAVSTKATITVNFPGLSSVHVYAHATDGAAGTANGAQAASSTWRSDSTTLSVNKGTYDIRIVHGPGTMVIDNVNCSADCTVNVPLATLTVNFPGLTSAHVYAHLSDGAPGSYGAEDSSSTWKDNSTSLVLLQSVYDVRVVHGPTTVVLDNIDCRQATCSATVPLATLTVSFPGLTSAHSYAHKTDGAPGTYGAEDTSSTWKDNGTSMVLLQAIYDVRVVHGPTSVVLDDVNCQQSTCSVNVPLAKLTVNFPGLTSAHSYAHKADGSPGTYGAEDTSSTWKDSTTSMVLLQNLYDVRVVHGPTQLVFDDIDCRQAECTVNVPLATLTVNFPGLTSAHTYAHKSDGATGTYGNEDSSSTWKDSGTTLTLLQSVYDVRVVHGPMQSVFDNVDCRAVTCVVDVPLARLTVNFPGLTSAHTYAHKSDGAAGSVGAEDSSSTWKNDTAGLTLLQNVYDVRVVHGPTTSVIDNVDCRAEVCTVEVPLAVLTASFPGHTSVHTYVRKDDSTSGTATGPEDSSATWKNDGATFTLLRSTYDVFMQEGNKSYVVDAVDCRGATCAVAMPNAVATVTPSATATSAPTQTPTPTVTASPTQPTTATPATPTTAPAARVAKFSVDAFVWDDSDKTSWVAANPKAQWIFLLSDQKGTGIKKFTDAEGMALESGVYTVTLLGNVAGEPKMSAYDFVLLTDPSASCEGPGGVQDSLTIVEANFDKADYLRVCAFLKEAPVTATVRKSFVSATDTEVTWRLQPSGASDLLVWDEAADGCEAFGGAACGGIGKGDYGKFYVSAKDDQYLLVTQNYKKDGDACEVTNVAQWARDLEEKPDSVSATYKCSGASTMGWGLFGLFAISAVSLAWVVQKKTQWAH
ncbi:MAG: hypothetical protein ABI577_02735 [bacterium]